jgi:octaprenyl-diphosphate synthase
MERLSEITALVSDDLKSFDRLFREVVRTRVPLLNTVTRYLIRRKGKQMRPVFVLLSAGMHGPVTDRAHRAAALVELLHTATLIHDDVVDEAWRRRGVLSLNAVWRNKIAVLVGDYLLSRGMLLALEHRDYDQLHIVSDATRAMSEGELLQLEKARRLDISEDVYFEIIRKKTASLIASCCAIGTHAAGAADDVSERMKLFGEKVGIAFQLKDDLFDYTTGHRTGKSSGTDLKEKKLTLPLIHMLQQMGSSERRKTLGMIRRHRHGDGTAEALQQLVEQYGGIRYAREQMERYRDEALAMLEAFPQNDYSGGLKKLVVYTTERTR